MPKRMMRKSEREDLLHFVASRGQSYEKYTEYAKSRGWPLYTRGSYLNFIQRHRQQVQEERLKIHMEIRNVNDYDRKKRLDECEAALRVLDDLIFSAVNKSSCEVCGQEDIDSAEVIKLLEQKRKYLEQIAKERNEWLKEDEGTREVARRQTLRDIAVEALSEAQETKILDGKVVVVSH